MDIGDGGDTDHGGILPRVEGVALRSGGGGGFTASGGAGRSAPSGGDGGKDEGDERLLTVVQM
jgi:hypothetical protein